MNPKSRRREVSGDGPGIRPLFATGLPYRGMDAERILKSCFEPVDMVTTFTTLVDPRHIVRTFDREQRSGVTKAIHSNSSEGTETTNCAPHFLA